VLPGLKLGRVREMEDRLKARIAGLLDKVETFGGEFDFVQHIAAPFPLRRNSGTGIISVISATGERWSGRVQRAIRLTDWNDLVQASSQAASPR